MENCNSVRVHRKPGRPSACGVFQCPLCGRFIAPEIQSFTTRTNARIDAPVERILHQEHPSGVCPECAHQAAERDRLERSPVSLQDELRLPYPVYDRQAARLLPTTERLGASPQYAGQGVTLAFLDSGFYPHPDLVKPENRILQYVDATGSEPLEGLNFNQSHISSWHGLMTSSVAAGNGYWSDGLYRGIASQAGLVLVKIGHAGGHGIREADIQRGLAWVIANRMRYAIRVVNISVSGDHPTQDRLGELDRQVEEAVSQGLVVVAAAGNSGAERLAPPASAPSAITVGGLDDANSLDSRLWRLYHSSYGRSPAGSPKPEVIAPATWLAAPMLPRTWVHTEGMLLWQLDEAVEGMLRRLRRGARLPARRGYGRYHRLEAMRRKIRRRMIDQKYIHPHYQHVDGTSMAAPIVSSIAAQMLEANPALTPAQVREILASTASPLEGFPGGRQGTGMVNARRAVAEARRTAGGPLSGLPASPQVQPDRVRFVYFDPGRKTPDSGQAGPVALVGSFNGWNPQGYALQPLSPGLWEISIPLPPPGSYRYKYLLDGGWVDDPENPDRVEDGYGGYSSRLEVGI